MEKHQSERDRIERENPYKYWDENGALDRDKLRESYHVWFRNWVDTEWNNYKNQLSATDRDELNHFETVLKQKIESERERIEREAPTYKDENGHFIPSQHQIAKTWARQNWNAFLETLPPYKALEIKRIEALIYHKKCRTFL